MESGNQVQKNFSFMKNKSKKPYLDEKIESHFVTPTIVRHPKFDSNLANGLSFDNPFAPELKPSDLFLNSPKSQKKSLKILNFHGNDFSFPTIKPESIDSWASNHSKISKKLTENNSNAEIYLSKFNNSEIKTKKLN